MTDAQRRYGEARAEIIERFHLPIAKLLDSTQAAMAEQIQRAERAETALEVLREAHEASTAALGALWGLLKVGNQTEAVARLEQLLLTEHRVSIDRNAGDVL